MAHLCVPQNQALGVCRGFVPDIQICGTHGRKDLVNATIISNAEEEEEQAGWTESKANRNTMYAKANWPDSSYGAQIKERGEGGGRGGGGGDGRGVFNSIACGVLQ